MRPSPISFHGNRSPPPPGGLMFSHNLWLTDTMTLLHPHNREGHVQQINIVGLTRAGYADLMEELCNAVLWDGGGNCALRRVFMPLTCSFVRSMEILHNACSDWTTAWNSKEMWFDSRLRQDTFSLLQNLQLRSGPLE